MSSAVGLHRLSGASWSSARSASASACSTPPGIMCARKAATHGSIVALPSESGSADVAPSARASHRSASAGRPVSARIQAPKTASAGYRTSSSSLNHASHSSSGLHAPVVVDRQRKGVDQAGDGVRLARGVPVDDRRLRKVVGDAPRHRAAVELGHDLRLAPRELVAQQLAEQVVVAVPLASPVQRHDEAVRPLERLERASRPRRLQHRVAQTAATSDPGPTCTSGTATRLAAAATAARSGSSRTT